jgi:hypothetical protein
MTGRAEAMREVKPDAGNPHLVNGSFEESYKEDAKDVPKSWHYVRQATLVDDDQNAPEGKRYIVFKNETAGRGCQALQGFAVDGKLVKVLGVDFDVQGTNLRFGATRDEMPTVYVTFYDERQDIVGTKGIGPWRGTFPWQHEHAELDVPMKAKTAIIRIGLLGAVGDLAMDNFRLAPVKKP